MEIKETLQNAYRQMSGRPRFIIDIVKDTIQSFQEAKGTEGAASIAYYAIFSLFPLLLLFVSVGSLFIEQGEVFRFVEEAFPASDELIRNNVEQVMAARGSVGLIGFITLLWSASGAFSVLAAHINQAWEAADERGFLEKRLVALGMLAGIGLLLAATILASTIFELLPRLQIPLLSDITFYDSWWWRILSLIIPYLLALVLFWSLYRWVPEADVPWENALLVAALVALLWELARNLFVWYLSSGLASYDLVYGSLGAVVALMFWIYINAMITLIGAHLSQAIHRHRGKIDG
jgi:membrane protein